MKLQAFNFLCQAHASDLNQAPPEVFNCLNLSEYPVLQVFEPLEVLAV
jgi:hypothetical protein